MIAADLQSLATNAAQLQLLPGNPRRGDIEAVRRSLEAFGQRKPIVARREDKVVIAGNHTLQAAQALGWDEIAVVWVDDDEVTSKAFALADNRTAELGDYDEEALADLINDVGSLNPALLESSGWDDKAVQELLDRVEQTELPADVDEVPEDVPAVSKLGDVWLLGDHRVTCGDSTDANDVAKLMNAQKADMIFTDPPYGVDYDGGHADKNIRRKKLANDENADIYKKCLPLIFAESKKEAALYLWFSDSKSSAVISAVISAGYEIRNTLIWNKNLAQFGAIGAQYKSKHEPCIYAYKSGKAPYWNGPTNEVSVWDISRESKNEFHPTQKPVDLGIRAMTNSCPKNGLVLDLFGGSGSTLIAAHETKRIAYLMELDPHYVDVICARYQKHTGVLPVLESSGKVHDFLNV